ncbi:sensor histidine kinase [Anoxynatronum buryatiense]|uniref:Histidine kinase-, DNA gyrase B-, and HSP90-like ATPase n=1 Tax=Anoxynatronum buryatiense TaxID=489973 RepID=A0AA45WXN6_9CLOT|nr:histidine kinase [Anoxynatronum buryatiense]SMP65289.1 Histidine kinase-, DNA gyrase B-, and HSP90-like ATPase [Anoxynatronum buryatiense]
MIDITKHHLASFCNKISRRIIYKLLLIIILPNMIFLFMIQHLMNQHLKQQTLEMDNMLHVLNHAVSREISSLFNNMRALSSEVIVNPDVQRILTGKYPRLMTGYPYDIWYKEQLSDDRYLDNRTMEEILSHYRILWDVFSIAVISCSNDIYLSTSPIYDYHISPSDLKNSHVLQSVQFSDSSDFSWSVNDALTQDHNVITLARQIHSIDNPQEIAGYIVINLSLEKVKNSFYTYSYYETMIFGLIDENGQRWMIYDGHEISGGNTPPFDDIRDGLFSSFWQGQPWHLYLSINESGNHIIAGIDESYMIQRFNDFRKTLFLSYTFFLLAAIFISIYGTKSITDRLHQLEKAIRSFGDKNWKTRISLRGNDEIQMIGNTFNEMAHHIEDLVENVKEEQHQKRLFELKVLDYQINPHFLYNTLDSINWLALENDQQEVSQMVNGLARLFRIILSKGSEFFALREEFEMVGIYLDIQKIRFGERFEYSLFLDPAISQYPIGKLLLQPLVENAIVHGTKGLRTKGHICIRGTRQNGQVVLEVKDNGVGMPADVIGNLTDYLKQDIWHHSVPAELGYGVKNVDSRLKLAYGIHSSLTISSTQKEPSGTSIQIHIDESALQKIQQTAGRS